MYLSSVSSRLILHDINSWDLKKSYGCYEGILRDISWSDDGKYLLQVNPKGLIEILNTNENDICSLQHVPFRDTWSGSFHRDGHRNVAIGTRSGNVLIWDTRNKTITKTFPTPTQQSPVNFVSFNSKNTSLAAAMQNGDTVIYGLVSNVPVATVKLACSKSISAMKFHHECRALLGLATDEGHVVLRDIASNKDKIFFENVHASPVSDFVYSPVNKDVMLSSGFDKIMHVYDIRLQNVVSTTRTSYPLSSLTISLDNKVALGAKNGVIMVYDLRDLTNPFIFLKGHDENVKKLCFQPVRRKSMSTEISLREDDSTPLKLSSPMRNRNSGLFFVTDTPPKVDSEVVKQAGDNEDDSFLAMMGLDKTNEPDVEGDRSAEFDQKSDRNEIRYRQLDAEKHISKISTPLNSRTADNMFNSPHIIITNGSTEDNDGSCSNISNIKQSCTNLQISPGSMGTQSVDDLKDFVKMSLANVADENRNYFLHLMMALTKQKLFLEKQLAGMNVQIVNLIQNQNALVEINRKLSVEIDELKSQQCLLLKKYSQS